MGDALDALMAGMGGPSRARPPIGGPIRWLHVWYYGVRDPRDPDRGSGRGRRNRATRAKKLNLKIGPGRTDQTPEANLFT